MVEFNKHFLDWKGKELKYIVERNLQRFPDDEERAWQETLEEIKASFILTDKEWEEVIKKAEKNMSRWWDMDGTEDQLE